MCYFLFFFYMFKKIRVVFINYKVYKILLNLMNCNNLKCWFSYIFEKKIGFLLSIDCFFLILK